MESERERKQVSNKSTRFHASKMIDARGRCTGGNTSRDISLDRSQIYGPLRLGSHELDALGRYSYTSISPHATHEGLFKVTTLRYRT